MNVFNNISRKFYYLIIIETSKSKINNKQSFKKKTFKNLHNILQNLIWKNKILVSKLLVHLYPPHENC